MDLALVMKVAGIGMIVTVCCQVLSKAGRDEQSTLVSIGGIVVVLLLIVDEIAVLIRTLCEVFGL